MKNIWNYFAILGLLIGSLNAQDNAGIKALLLGPTDAKREGREVPVKIYFPETKSTKLLPVILFSHGLGGSREGSPYLGNAWAKAGYIAVFMQHIGSDSSIWKGVPRAQIFEALKSGASAQSLINRIADVPFVIDQLEKWNVESGHALKGKLDLTKIGMSGHSFGGVTTQAMLGAKYPGNREFSDPRLKAFLIMSPSVAKATTAKKSFSHIKSPALCMTGSLDGDPLQRGAPPEAAAAKRREVYAAMPKGDKYELVFEGGQHATFSEKKRRNRKQSQDDSRCHPAIVEISTRFFDAYLKGDTKSKTWLQSRKPAEELDLIEGDVWAWK